MLTASGKRVSKGFICNMADKIKHRGPDNFDLFLSGNISWLPTPFYSRRK